MKDPIFVQIPTADGLTLPGLLYEAVNSKKIMIHLHGNGSSSVFYSDDQMLELAQELNNAGISLLMFNNRGAHLIKKLNSKKKDGSVERKRFGMAYEIIKECVYDIDAAIDLVESKGYERISLIGFSTGANKICVYNYYKPKNKIASYILVSGGDDTGLYYFEFGKEKFTRLFNESKEKVERGKGEDVICELLPYDFFSYQGFYDIANSDGDYNTFPFLEAMGKAKLSTKPLFRYFKGIKKPTLVVYGEKDEYQYGDVRRVVNILKEQQPNFTYEVIPGADHGISHHQKQLATVIVNWLKRS